MIAGVLRLAHLKMLNVLILTFLVLIRFGSQLSFDFQSFSTNDTSTLFAEGDAHLGPGFLRLTKNADDHQIKYGRTTYKHPFLLQDHGELTSFTTTFSFSIQSPKTTNYGDGGLAFFVAPYGSLLSASAAGGNTLGLPFNSSNNNANYEYPFVAVEFHISSKPNDDHVGIDVSSLNSLITAHWDEGKINTVTVRYDSSTKNLTVAYSTDVHPKTLSISYMVDLSEHFPDWVIVGFSASTGRDSSALHQIISWNFTSSLDEYNQKDEELVALASISAIQSPAPSSWTDGNYYYPDYDYYRSGPSGPSVGIVVMIVVIVIVVITLICFLFWKKRRSRRRKREKDPISAIEKEFANGACPKKFSYKELARATNNFAEEKKLGEGGFGGVYRGFFKASKLLVAVKRISERSEQGVKEYAAEIRTISALCAHFVYNYICIMYLCILIPLQS